MTPIHCVSEVPAPVAREVMDLERATNFHSRDHAKRATTIKSGLARAARGWTGATLGLACGYARFIGCGLVAWGETSAASLTAQPDASRIKRPSIRRSYRNYPSRNGECLQAPSSLDGPNP